MAVRQSKQSIGPSATFDSPTLAGSTLVAILCADPTGLASFGLTDSKGNSTAGSRKVSTDGGGGVTSLSVWVLENIANAGASHALSATGVGTFPEYSTFTIYEIDGAPASSYDSAVTATRRDTDGTPYTLTTGAPAQSGEIILTAITSEGSSVLDFAASGWTRDQQRGDFTEYWGQADFSKVGTTGGQVFSATATGGSSTMLIAAVGIKQGGQAYVLSVDPAAYTVAAAPVTTARAAINSVASIAYSVAAAPVTISRATTASVAPAVYTVAVAPVSIQRAMRVAPAGYAIAAPAIAAQAARVAAVPLVTYTVTPAPVAVSGNAPGAVDPASYAIAWPAVGGGVQRVLAVDPVAHIVAAAPVATARAAINSVAPAVYAVGVPAVGAGLARAVPVPAVTYAVTVAPVSSGLSRVGAVGALAYSIGTPPVRTTATLSVAIAPAVYGIAWPDVTGDQGVEPTQWVFTTIRAEDRSAVLEPESRQSTIAPEVRRWSISP